MKVRELRFRHYLKGFPLFGGLTDCTLQDHWESIRQMTVIVVLSMAPVWLGSLIVYATGSNLAIDIYWAALQSTARNGELFMYATALLAPVFWMAQVDPPGAQAFPSKVSHMCLIGIIDLIAGALFGLITARQSINPTFVSRASTTVFCSALVLLYLGTVYHTSRLPNVSGEFRKQEDDFSAAYGEHRK